MSAPQPRHPPARTWVPLSCWAEDLVGGRGAVRALVSCLVLVLLTGMAFVAGLATLVPVALVLVTSAVLLVRGAGRSRYAVVMVALGVLGVAALVYVWLAWGVELEAIDASPIRAAPAWTRWQGTSLLLALGCAVAFAVTAALSLRHRRAAAGRSR